MKEPKFLMSDMFKALNEKADKILNGAKPHTVDSTKVGELVAMGFCPYTGLGILALKKPPVDGKKSFWVLVANPNPSHFGISYTFIDIGTHQYSIRSSKPNVVLTGGHAKFVSDEILKRVFSVTEKHIETNESYRPTTDDYQEYCRKGLLFCASLLTQTLYATNGEIDCLNRVYDDTSLIGNLLNLKLIVSIEPTTFDDYRFLICSHFDPDAPKEIGRKLQMVFKRNENVSGAYNLLHSDGSYPPMNRYCYEPFYERCDKLIKDVYYGAISFHPKDFTYLNEIVVVSTPKITKHAHYHEFSRSTGLDLLVVTGHSLMHQYLKREKEGETDPSKNHWLSNTQIDRHPRVCLRDYPSVPGVEFVGYNRTVLGAPIPYKSYVGVITGTAKEKKEEEWHITYLSSRKASIGALRDIAHPLVFNIVKEMINGVLTETYKFKYGTVGVKELRSDVVRAEVAVKELKVLYEKTSVTMILSNPKSKDSKRAKEEFAKVLAKEYVDYVIRRTNYVYPWVKEELNAEQVDVGDVKKRILKMFLV